MDSTGKLLRVLVVVIGVPAMYGILFLGAEHFEWAMRITAMAVVALLVAIAQALFRIAYRRD